MFVLGKGRDISNRETLLYIRIQIQTPTFESSLSYVSLPPLSHSSLRLRGLLLSPFLPILTTPHFPQPQDMFVECIRSLLAAYNGKGNCLGTVLTLTTIPFNLLQVTSVHLNFPFHRHHPPLTFYRSPEDKNYVSRHSLVPRASIRSELRVDLCGYGQGAQLFKISLSISNLVMLYMVYTYLIINISRRSTPS